MQHRPRVLKPEASVVDDEPVGEECVEARTDTIALIHPLAAAPDPLFAINELNASRC